MKHEWRMPALEDVAKVVNGGTPKTKVPEYWGGPHSWITPAEMGGLPEPYLRESRRSLTDEGLARSSASLLPPKSVILSTRAPIGHLVINEKPMAFNQGCRGIVPGDQLHHKFLYYWLLSNVKKLDDLGSGTTFKELGAGKLKEFPVPMPRLSQQKRIVAILDEAFAGIETAIANTEKNLANARELSESYIDGILAKSGQNWVEAKLSQIVRITHGFAFKSKNFGTSDDRTKPIVLTPGNYTARGDLEFNERNTKRFFGDVPEGYKFDEGDLTVVMTDLSPKMKILGKPAFVRASNILHNQRIGRVVPLSEDVDLRYLYYFLRTTAASKQIKNTATGTMVRHTAPKRILALKVKFPRSAREQKEIVNKLDSVSMEAARIELIFEQKRERLQELKQSLLQKAFSGELTADRAEREIESATA